MATTTSTKLKPESFFLSIILILTFLYAIIQTQVGQTNLLLKKTGKTNQQLQRDWHDYEAMAKDEKRSAAGLGEFGKPAYLKELGNSSTDKLLQSLKKWGFNAELSTLISFERALPDVRHKSCRGFTYYSHLPKASIIIVYHNEERSVLIRTLYSILNRTPAELIEEIILIDDFSNPKLLGNNFEEQIQIKFRNKNWHEKLKIFHTDEHIGLIRARILGGRKSKGQILIFLDAHVEANHNWLPPLLHPIVDNEKTCTTPVIDTIHYENFAYYAATPSRGGFNWQFNYVQLPLMPKERKLLPQDHDNPVMNGGLFAIAKNFFWYLGSYDEGLEIWGAEQFELSFKIWMCGGRLLEVPCSRLGHLYRAPDYVNHYINRTDDFISRNYKRVAEVWMDSYKEYLYENIPKLNGIDAGNLDELKLLRKRLKCKSFKWFLDNIASDVMRLYPPNEPTDFASGVIQSLASTNFSEHLCLDTLNLGIRQIVYALRPCSPNLRYPYASQRWKLSFRHDIRDYSNDACLEAQSWKRNAEIWLWNCHNQGGNQFWHYDRNSQLLVQENGFNGNGHRCLEANITEQRAYLNECDFVKSTMKWRFGYINHTAMDEFFQNAHRRTVEE